MPRAVQIVHAEVASRVRTMIINACAARRAGNTPEEMHQLLRYAVPATNTCQSCASPAVGAKTKGKLPVIPRAPLL